MNFYLQDSRVTKHYMCGSTRALTANQLDRNSYRSIMDQVGGLSLDKECVIISIYCRSIAQFKLDRHPFHFTINP
jgi:hypothetical protein